MKNHIIFRLKLPQTDELDNKIDEAGFEKLSYNEHRRHYQLRLTEGDIKSKSEILEELSRLAYERRVEA